ncbi:dihydroxy-acid dehydratase [Bacillus sp. FJAT-45350]|uniref:dihydroxy-acid dehydratase n=1 Tax=Bacillus sp. FJAT-45350 TaxID=2011014 RepID=UPI000BB91031|nr:dihydroxy-acid dehydratase [Bacillus sp. FJAT-45350]
MSNNKNNGIDGSIFRSDNIEGDVSRAFMQGAGFSNEMLKTRRVIGICTSWSEVNPCNINLRSISESVKRGILAAGGVPVEFPTISIHEQLNNPSSLILRNLMAMDVEEMIQRSPIDGVVLLNGCDKTVPAQIMGAISAGKPTISLSAGPRNTSKCGGKVMTIHDLWSKKDERQKGEVTDQEWEKFISELIPSAGTCNVMGTASTMSSIVESLGLALPGSSFLPATSAGRQRIAEETGRIAVQLTEAKRTPDQIVTEKSLENAFRVVCAIGGSTNAVLHLEAIAGRLGIRIGVERFNKWSETTPQLVAVSPAGPYLLEDFNEAGGIPALVKRLSPKMHLDTINVKGETWAEAIGEVTEFNSPVLRSLENPINDAGGLAILQGSLAPKGAVFKRAAAPRELWRHSGPALVFDGLDDMNKRIDDPNLPVESNSVLVLRGLGPIGGPGMPESAKIPIPRRLWDQGVRDMLRISDGRMSGTADGAVVLHVSPESAIGGPLALVKDGDIIKLDAVECRLDLLVNEEELEERRKTLVLPESPSRGYDWLYHQHVTQANEGADFDFLLDSNLPRTSLSTSKKDNKKT